MSNASSRLEQILNAVRVRAAARRAQQSLSELRSTLKPVPERGARFVSALRSAAGGLAVIAECKRRSPSAGAFDSATPWEERAQNYASGGAHALSVLTEVDHFGGDPADLARVSGAGLPRLRKDFLIDEGMVWESIGFSADAILLIAEALPGSALAELRAVAREAGLAVLIEAHDAHHLERAIAATPECVGVNARDLATFRVDTQRAAELLTTIPANFVRVAESGLRTMDDLRRAHDAGADAVLIGESLMRAADPAALLRGWRVAFAPPTKKVCGITCVEDARHAILHGADAIGVVLSPSPRQISVTTARAIVRAVAPLPTIGVFASATRLEVESAVEMAGLAAAQLCGNERVEDFRGLTFPIWRRVPADAVEGARELAAWSSLATLFVIDHPSGAGGTGKTVDPHVARTLASSAPCLLAGGLSADNVAEMIAAIAPRGVDASSRLESKPGLKDPARVAAFLDAATTALRTAVNHE